MVCAHERVFKSQSLIVASEEPVTRAVPSGEAVRDSTQLLCPLRDSINYLLWAS